METVELKLKLIEIEAAYRERFFKFVQVLKRAGDDSELFKHTKTKTILKICEEVLKCSDDLLLVLHNRKRISQQPEAIYKVFEQHHVQAVDILSSYCTNLLDVRSLLLSSLVSDCSELKLSRLLHEALQPVCHVEEVLLLLQEIKEHLDAKRRLVEIFSCNSLIDKLTKGLERIHRVIAGLHAEELLLALQVMKINGDTRPPSLTSTFLAEDSEAINAENLPETFTTYAELTPTASDGNQQNLPGQIRAVIQMESGGPVHAEETAHLPLQSQDTGFDVEEGQFKICDDETASTSLVEVGKTQKLSETHTSRTDVHLPLQSHITRIGDEEGQFKICDDETASTSLAEVGKTEKLSETYTSRTDVHLPLQSQDTRIGDEEAQFKICDDETASTSLAEVGKTEKLFETHTSRTDLRLATESNEQGKELVRQDDTVNKKIAHQCVINADNDLHCSSLPQSTEIPIVSPGQCDVPDLPKQTKRKPPIPLPRIKSTVNSAHSGGTSVEGDHSKNKQRETVVIRRESKKLIRSEVLAISMQISQLKGHISSLEQKIVGMESSESSENSENSEGSENSENSGSGDEDNETATGEYPEVFEESENAVSSPQKVDVDCSGVTLRSASTHYDAGLRSRRTKHLLHSTIWQVPLYQEYHDDLTTALAASASVSGAQEEKSEGVEDTASGNDLDSRPESGIELEGEGDVDESLGCYYTPMWNNGSGLEEGDGKSVEYVSMNGASHTGSCSYEQYNPKFTKSGWKWEETKHSSTPTDSSHYETMSRTYANMSFGNASEAQCESVYTSVHDIFGAVQVEKETAVQEFFRDEVTHIVLPPRAKQIPGWCNIPAVKESGVLEKMTKRERHLQEAKYELISSQVSFLKSLSVLQAIFIANVHLKRLMSTTEWDNLFQYIDPIKQCSEHFLADLLSGWPQDIFLSNQLLIVRQYALSGLQTYVNYCSNKVTMDKTLAEIRSKNTKVNMMIKKLESDEICDNNTLESFLVLPIQRITRFPLLVEGILCRMDSNTDKKEFCDWAKTYRELVQMAKRCNDAVIHSDETVEIRHDENVHQSTSRLNRISSPFRKSTKSATLSKRHRSTIWHDTDEK